MQAMMDDDYRLLWGNGTTVREHPAVRYDSVWWSNIIINPHHFLVNSNNNNVRYLFSYSPTADAPFLFNDCAHTQLSDWKDSKRWTMIGRSLALSITNKQPPHSKVQYFWNVLVLVRVLVLLYCMSVMWIGRAELSWFGSTTRSTYVNNNNHNSIITRWWLWLWGTERAVHLVRWFQVTMNDAPHTSTAIVAATSTAATPSISTLTITNNPFHSNPTQWWERVVVVGVGGGTYRVQYVQYSSWHRSSRSRPIHPSTVHHCHKHYNQSHYITVPPKSWEYYIWISRMAQSSTTVEFSCPILHKRDRIL